MNLKLIETFRTKEELVNYFKKMGQNITKEEIDTLKKNYEQVEKNNGALSLQQLDKVAGGLSEWLGGILHNFGKAITGFLGIQSSIRDWNKPQVNHDLPKVFGKPDGLEICVNKEDVRECYQIVDLSKNEKYSFLQYGDHNLCAVQESRLEYYDDPSLQSLMASYLLQSKNPIISYLTCFKEKDFEDGAKIFKCDDLRGYVLGFGENGELLIPAGQMQFNCGIDQNEYSIQDKYSMIKHDTKYIIRDL